MDNLPLLLKVCTTIDLDKLIQISQKTYYDTFIESNSAEDMQIYLETSMSRERLLMELNNKESIFYLAYVDNELIGYLKINKGAAQTENFEQPCLELERIYILKEYHGKKLALLLLQKAIEQAKEMDAKFIWLGVWEKNFRALRFYEKNGFVKFGEHNFAMGNDIQIDQLMKLDLG